MRAVTFAEANQDLDETLERIQADGQPVLLRGPRDHAFILMPCDNPDGWDETAYLLATPENARHLAESVAQLAAGRTVQLADLIDP